MSGDGVAPIIIKRKKVSGGDGHHGGAWKVAYADFVTAMMAFFLLMWLLNATTEKQRKGIADYFTPTIALTRVSGGGDGALGGESVFAENTLPRMGSGSTSLNVQPRRQSLDGASGALTSDKADAEGEAEEEAFKEVAEMLMGRGGESMVADETLDHIVTDVTDEGLVIEVFETEEARLFDDDNQPTPLLRDIARVLISASVIVNNPIAVEGHTASYPLVLARNPSWDVSGLRATRFRELLTDQGLSSSRVHRVTSHADREPNHDNPMDVRNNRLEIVFLRNL
ncbi:flagellar motor protein MotB [Tropicibacter naphthalenivorans]|uniref:Chemotaxis protein MotB n=1 Tax=Tropicibacter naphthalenivorans TaxID=441103 RepID=A0A0P1GV02_9RHOB|nr:flagellar motor protein MotB [Tropicibacter naphthalenivorans]CUH79684.1 Chemotaxis protein MotB [Tropicibacter naphthalenivorans]SMC74435.1 chemotaxis protein MotB [Tropicibacter naphthalenivorans]